MSALITTELVALDADLGTDQSAVAYGSASAGLPGSAVPTPDQVDPAAVSVTPGFAGRTPPAPVGALPVAGPDAR